MKGRYSWQDEMLSRLKNIDGKLKKMSDTCTIDVSFICDSGNSKRYGSFKRRW